MRLLCVLLVLPNVYMYTVGKKSFGKAAADVLNISVDFAENINAIQLPANSANGNGGGSLSKLFFEVHIVAHLHVHVLYSHILPMHIHCFTEVGTAAN